MDTGIPPIVTERLTLISLDRQSLLSILDGNFEEAGAHCGFKIGSGSSLLRSSRIRHRLSLIERDARQLPWMYRAIVRRSDWFMVGHISFHHMGPDPDLAEYSDKAVELGYVIDTEFRRNGYARESVRGMAEWAFGRGMDTICLSISPANVPSLRLAESMGFRRVAERMDDTDGMEYVYLAGKGELWTSS